MSKPCHFFFQNQNETQIFTISEPNIMKKSKYQQYFHYFIICILGPYAFWFSFQQNIVTILTNAVFTGAALRGEALIRGRCLFLCGYPKVRRLLEGGAYLRSGAYQRKHGISPLYSQRFDRYNSHFQGQDVLISFKNEIFTKMCFLQIHVARLNMHVGKSNED